jgi:hypothetical protein
MVSNGRSSATMIRSSWVWSACQMALECSASRRWCSSKASRYAALGERDEGGIERRDDGAHGGVCRWRPALPLGDVEGLPVDPGDCRRRSAQGQAFDEHDQLAAQTPLTAVASCAPGEAYQAVAPVVGQPSLCRAHGSHTGTTTPSPSSGPAPPTRSSTKSPADEPPSTGSPNPPRTTRHQDRRL